MLPRSHPTTGKADEDPDLDGAAALHAPLIACG